MKQTKTLVILLVVAGVLLAACGGGGGSAGAAPTLKIVSSLPLTGSSLTQTDAIVKAIQLKLKQINNQVCGGKYKIAYESKDDASAALGKWDPAVETENANKAAADKAVIAYIGTFNSGAAKLSIPILNKAEVVMVSPANTNPGLTKPGKGASWRAGHVLSQRQAQLRACCGCRRHSGRGGGELGQEPGRELRLHSG